MILLLLEALGAGLLFIGIIWWTMFAGRDHGELRRDPPTPDEPSVPAPASDDVSK